MRVTLPGLHKPRLSFIFCPTKDSLFLPPAPFVAGLPRVSFGPRLPHFLDLSNRIVYRFGARLAVALGGFSDRGDINERGLLASICGFFV